MERRDTSGFTLVELMVVVTILGLLTAIAAPRIDLARMRLEAGLRGTASALLGAQRLAVVRQHDVVVLVRADGGGVIVHQDRNNNGDLDAGEPERHVTFGEAVVADRGDAPAFAGIGAAVNLAAGRGGLPGVVFHRNGSASQAGGFYLTSRRAAGPDVRPYDTRYLAIERATGRTSWHRYAAGGWRRGF